MLWHQADLHPFRGTQARGKGVFPLEKMRIFLLNEIDLGIRAVGVMVEQRQASDLGVNRQLPHLRYGGMAPAMLVWHVGVKILRVVNKQIGAAAEFDPLIIADSRPDRWCQFMIRGIDARHPVLFDTIGIATTGMVDGCAPDIEIFSGRQHVEVLRDALCPGGQLTCAQRKIRTVNLVKQGTDLAVFFRSAGKYSNTPVRLIDRCEIRIALNVVPMAMGQQNGDLIVALPEPFAELPNAGTRVQDQVLAAVQLDIDAGGVPAVFCGCRPRNRDRATNTVEGYYQLSSQGSERQCVEYGSDTRRAQACK